MQTLIHRGDSRGHFNHGWLDTYHTFSFADYYDPERVHFGALRVVNDDYVAGGMGFGRHPHDNMEIVTIMLEGELKHSDSMGHTEVLHPNEVQTMTAGTGIFHSEFNNLPDIPVKLLQIWVFPEKQNLKPRYEQMEFDPALRLNQWQLLVSPESTGKSLEIKQQAWFSRIELKMGHTADYHLNNKQSGIYLFLIDGKIIAGPDLTLERRDGAGIWDVGILTVRAEQDTDLLLMEIPFIG